MMTQTTKYLLAARLTARSVDIEDTYLDHEQRRKSLLRVAVIPNYAPTVRNGHWSVGKLANSGTNIGPNVRRNGCEGTRSPITELLTKLTFFFSIRSSVHLPALLSEDCRQQVVAGIHRSRVAMCR